MSLKIINKKEEAILNARNFIFSLLKSFNNTVDYCLVRGQIDELNPLTSDVDVMINKKDYSLFFDALQLKQELLNFKIVNIIKRQYVFTHILYLEDEKIFTQIDTEFDFDWWGFTIMSSSSILNRKRSNEEGIFIASYKDISIMKLYRSLFWGKRVSNKYGSQDILFDRAHLENNSTISLENDQNVAELVSYYSTDSGHKIQNLRKKVVRTNIKLNKIKSLMKFIDFIVYEFKLLKLNNGARLYITGEESLKLDFINRLKEYIDFYNAPFKSYANESNLSFIQKRKKLRDSYVLFTKKIKRHDFRVNIKNQKEVIIENHHKKMIFSIQDINKIVKFIYQ